MGGTVDRRLADGVGHRARKLLKSALRRGPEAPGEPVEPAAELIEQRRDVFGVELGQAEQQLVELGEQDGKEEGEHPRRHEVEKEEHKDGGAGLLHARFFCEFQRRGAQQRRHPRAQEEGQRPAKQVAHSKIDRRAERRIIEDIHHDTEFVVRLHATASLQQNGPYKGYADGGEKTPVRTVRKHWQDCCRNGKNPAKQFPMDIFTRTDLQNLRICDKVTVYFGG